MFFTPKYIPLERVVAHTVKDTWGAVKSFYSNHLHPINPVNPPQRAEQEEDMPEIPRP